MVYASSIYLFIVQDTFSYRQEVLYQKQKKLSTTFFIFLGFFLHLIIQYNIFLKNIYFVKYNKLDLIVHKALKPYILDNICQLNQMLLFIIIF